MNHIVGLAHVALKVKDLEKSLNFYKQHLGFPEMLRLHHDDGSLFLVYLRVTDTQYIEIFPDGEGDRAPGGNATGVHHFCLEIDNVEAFIDAYVANGGTAFGEWRKMVFHATDKPSINMGLDGNRQCWIVDPDGNRIEMMEMDKNSLQYQAIRRLRAEKA